MAEEKNDTKVTFDLEKEEKCHKKASKQKCQKSCLIPAIAIIATIVAFSVAFPVVINDGINFISYVIQAHGATSIGGWIEIELQENPISDYVIFNENFKGPKPIIKDQNGELIQGFKFTSITPSITLEFAEPLTDCSDMFSGTRGIKKIDLNELKTISIINVSNMFKDSDVEIIDMEDFNSDKIESAAGMFSGCTNLKEIIFPSKFNVGKSASSMFKGTGSLVDFDTKPLFSNNLENLDAMFMGSAIKKISFSEGFKVNNVKNANYMFSHAQAQVLNMKRINFTNLESFDEMLTGCKIIKFRYGGVPKEGAEKLLKMFADAGGKQGEPRQLGVTYRYTYKYVWVTKWKTVYDYIWIKVPKVKYVKKWFKKTVTKMIPVWKTKWETKYETVWKTKTIKVPKTIWVTKYTYTYYYKWVTKTRLRALNEKTRRLR